MWVYSLAEVAVGALFPVLGQPPKSTLATRVSFVAIKRRLKASLIVSCRIRIALALGSSAVAHTHIITHTHTENAYNTHLAAINQAKTL